MWRKHSREYYVLVFGTIVLGILLFAGVALSFLGISLMSDLMGNITKNDTHITFKLDNKREWIEGNLTVIGASYYSIPNSTEFTAMTLNTTYICQITVNDPGIHLIVRNNSISNCSRVG